MLLDIEVNRCCEDWFTDKSKLQTISSPELMDLEPAKFRNLTKNYLLKRVISNLQTS